MTDYAVEFDPNCEGLIFSTDGRPIHGTSLRVVPEVELIPPAIAGGPNSSKDGKPGTQEDRRVQHIVQRYAIKNGKYQFVMELSVNAMFGLGLNGFRHQRPDVSAFSGFSLGDRGMSG
jgi:alpha-mannosidase